MASRPWTEDEDKTLIDMVRTHSFSQIAEKLKGRTRCGCIARYHRIAKDKNLSLIYGRRKHIRAPTAGSFTDVQSLKMLQLIENEKLPKHRVAKKMRRSTASIVSHYDEIMSDLAASERAR